MSSQVYNRFQMSPCIEGYGENIVYESKNCCKQNLYTFLLNNQKLSFSVLSVFLWRSIVSTWIMARKLNSRKVNNCCIHIKYLVNGCQPENNFLWDKFTILSTVSIWEINYGRSNITVHLMSTKDLVLNLLNYGKHSGSFDEFSNETAEKLPISSLLPTWILLKKNSCGQPKVIMP